MRRRSCGPSWRRCSLAPSWACPATSPTTPTTIASWVKKLKEDKREIFRAAADAQRIADYLLAFHPDYAAAEPSSSEQEAAPSEMAEAA